MSELLTDDVVLDDRTDDDRRLRSVTLDVDADDLLDKIRDAEEYVTETRYTSDTLVSVAVDGYGPAAMRVYPVTGPPEEKSFDDYFSPVDETPDPGIADKTALTLYPYDDGRRERMAAAVGYVVELAASVE